LGVAFQIINDLKDWEGDDNNKLIDGQDALAARPTLLLALALRAASPEQREDLLHAIHCGDRSAVTVARIPSATLPAVLNQARSSCDGVIRTSRSSAAWR
jgi:geranylgeranyl pyrophosphate synthase